MILLALIGIAVAKSKTDALNQELTITFSVLRTAPQKALKLPLTMIKHSLKAKDSD